MADNFDLASLALGGLAPGNEILVDDLGFPSIMVKIPKATYAQLGLGASTATFPAFIVNGTEVDEIYISKYLNCIMNGRAYSLPGQDPANTITFDNAMKACTDKGAGWHLMTALEWGALIAWCENNGYIPLGNNNYGKHSSESNYKAIPSAGHSSSQWATRTATGTGPLTWYHDKSPDGIADLCGDVWEWTGGIRTVHGELQILVNNNAADSSHPQTAASAEWKAINASDGTLVEPNGSGTTSGTVKMDYVGSVLKYDTTVSDTYNSYRSCNFSAITCSSNISTAAKDLLIALGMHPKASSIISGHLCYWNAYEAERSFGRGGHYDSSSGGFASFYGNYGRGYAYGSIGFRSAFVKLPAA